MGASCSSPAEIAQVSDAARQAPVHRLLAADGGLLDRAESGKLLRGTARSDRAASDQASRSCWTGLSLAWASAPLVLVKLDALAMLVTALALLPLHSATLRLIAAGQLGLLLVEAEGVRALVRVYAVSQRGRPLRLRARASAPYSRDCDAAGGWRALAHGAALGPAAASWWDALTLAWYLQPALLPPGWRAAPELGAFAAAYGRVRGLVSAGTRALPNALLLAALLAALRLEALHGGPGPLSPLLAALAAADALAAAAGMRRVLLVSLGLSLASVLAHAPQLARALRQPRRWALGGEAPLFELAAGALAEAHLSFVPGGDELEALCGALVQGARLPAPAVRLGHSTPVDSRRLDSLVRASVFSALLEADRRSTALRARDCGLRTATVRKLAPALSGCAQLALLDLSANGLEDADAVALIDGAALAGGGRVLDLSSNQLSRNAAGSLKRWLLAPACKLSKLVLERNQLGDDALALLASGLGANRTLTHLSLGSNRISHGGALALSNALGAALGARAAIKAPGCESVMPAWRTAHAKEIAARGVSRVGERELDAVGPTRRDRVGVNKTLRYLDLSNNPALGDAGALALANALRVNSALRSLLLADAGVGAPGAKALGDALSANGALVLLQLDRNGRIGDAGAAKLLRGLHGQTSLAHLSLCACGLTSPAAASIAAALIANDALERLELLGNRISDPGALVLGAALLQNTSLVTLDLSFNLLLSAASKAKLRAKWANGGRAPTGLTMY